MGIPQILKVMRPRSMNSPAPKEESPISFSPRDYLRGCLCGNWKARFLPRLYFTGVYFRGELQHAGHVGEQKIKCRPIRT